MKSLLLFIGLFINVFLFSCNRKIIFSDKEIKKIREIDSISKASKRVLIEDFREDIQFQEQY